MDAPDSIEFSAAETARNALLEHTLAAVLLANVDQGVRLRFSGQEPVRWVIREVHAEWFRAETPVQTAVFAPVDQLLWVATSVSGAGTQPDAIAPRFRGVLSELARRRVHVHVVAQQAQFAGIIMHAGADYLQLEHTESGPIVLRSSAVSWVELRRDPAG